MSTTRKTHTSTAVKNRWNKKHYDVVSFSVTKGAREEIKQLAEILGMSMAEYIRHLIISDAEKNGKNDVIPSLRGGG